MVNERKAQGSSQARRPARGDPQSANRPADADLPAELKQCPVCGQAMNTHTIERGAHDSILNCPVPHPGAWDRDAFLPVNEFGMVKRTGDSERSDKDGDRPE